MPKNEEGEFELILGNKQLLSVFFIVVVLLGVFFTMGYIVGRNSPLATADSTPGEKKEGKPMMVDSAATRESASTAAAPAKETPAQETAPAPRETAPQQPAESKPAPPVVAKRESPVSKREAPKPEPVKPKPEPVRSAAVDRPGGTYLQLAATSQREADIEVDVLRRKGFRAMSAEIPEKPGTFRVLVGPVPEGDVNKTKTDLQNAGFPGDKAIRRTL
jgi:cell division septation protein DedD